MFTGRVCGCVSPPAGFLVSPSPHKLCLSSQDHLLVLLPCDISDPAQQWAWLAGARLVHTQSSRCLWADPGLHLSARPVALGGCGAAPAWGCSRTDGAFGLADARSYLGNPGARLLIGGKAQPSEWRRYYLDSGGNARTTSLCPDTGEGERHGYRCAEDGSLEGSFTYRTTI